MLIPKDLKKRTIYLEKIIPFVDKNLIKVFVGQRRVGKSYVLYQIINYLQQQNKELNIIYINKEDIIFSTITNAIELNDYVQKSIKQDVKNYLFIDEIQDIQDFQVALRSFLLLENLDIYCTGSNANLLSSDIAGMLSGRYIEIQIYSLSYLEFLDFHQLENNEVSLQKFLKYGGLPYLKNLSLEDAVVFEYLKNIYATIVYRDIINRFQIRNVGFLEKLVLFLASNIGSLFSAKKISDFLKSQKLNISSNQVQIYLSYLTNAFLIEKAARYDLHGKRIFETGEKFYFENLGIRNALWGFRLEDQGKIIENAVFNYLISKGYDVKVGIIDKNEIDFIAEKQGEKAYYQVALTLSEEKTIEREFGNLTKINDNFPKTVITLQPFSGNSYQGIIHISLINFLSK
jgi:predicted AAA+ superfamily ATPase